LWLGIVNPERVYGCRDSQVSDDIRDVEKCFPARHFDWLVFLDVNRKFILNP
jgi:hypothetical protein